MKTQLTEIPSKLGQQDRQSPRTVPIGLAIEEHSWVGGGGRKRGGKVCPVGNSINHYLRTRPRKSRHAKGV